jgi:DNA replication protein DnaC
LCTFGLIDPPPSKGPSLREDRRAQALAGMIEFCTCRAGEAYRNLLLGAAPLTDAELQARDVAAARKRQQEKTFAHGEVPNKFREYTLAGYRAIVGKDKEKQEVLRRILEYFEHGFVTKDNEKRFGLYLWGESDKGKTGALSPLFLKLVESGQTGLWMNYNTMLEELKDYESGAAHERLSACKYCDVLFIDDFADPKASQVSDRTRDLIFQIIDYRNNYAKPMLITSNLGLDGIAQLFHERVSKRIAEACAVVRVGGKSMVQLKKEAKQS